MEWMSRRQLLARLAEAERRAIDAEGRVARAEAAQEDAEAERDDAVTALTMVAAITSGWSLGGSGDGCVRVAEVPACGVSQVGVAVDGVEDRDVA